MKNKKLCSILLALSILLGIGGCSTSKINEDALQLYMDAMENVKEYKSADFTATMVLDGAIQGNLILLNVDGSGAFQLEDDNPQFNFGMNLSINEMEVEDTFALYFKDNTFYYEVMNEKIKVSMENILATTVPQVTPNPSEPATIEEIKETLKEIGIKADGEDQLLHLAFDETSMQEEFDVQLKEINEGMDEKITIRNVMADITLDKDMFIKDLKYSFLLTSKGNTLKLELSVNLSDINKLETIAFPDFSDFIEMDVPLEEGLENLRL